MWIVNLEANPNGSHNDHRADHITTVPEGWAMIPDGFHVPSTFPFVTIKAEDVTFYRDVEVEKPVTKTRDTGMVDEGCNPIMETYTEMETVTEERKYTMMTVTHMTEGTLPEPVPEATPTNEERIATLEEQLAESDAVAMALYEASLEQETVNAEQDAAILGLYEMIGG